MPSKIQIDEEQLFTLGEIIAGSAPAARPTAFSSALTINRPANTTAYSANDVLGGAVVFQNMGPPDGGRVLITSASLEADIASVPAGMTNVLLHLYSAAPPSAVADNAVHDIPAGDRGVYLGAIDLGVPVDRGATLYVETNGINKPVKLAGPNLYGYLVTVGGFTPAGNSEVYVVTLHALAV